MPSIGEYRDLVSRYPRTLAAPDATGEEPESWAPASPAEQHWARIESPTGDESSEPPRQAWRGMRLRFRHAVALEATDHVYLEEIGEEYAVKGVWRERAESGGWQTVCAIGGPV